MATGTLAHACVLEAEGSIWTGGRSETEGWNGYVMLGTRQPKYHLLAWGLPQPGRSVYVKTRVGL